MVNVPHDSIWKKRIMGIMLSPVNCAFNVCVSSLPLTAVHHDAKLLQEEVDISVVFHFSSFSKHHENVPTAIQKLLQDMQLKRKQFLYFRTVVLVSLSSLINRIFYRLLHSSIRGIYGPSGSFLCVFLCFLPKTCQPR